MRTGTEQRQGLAVVISGPSGVGKTSIVQHVRDRLGGRFSVSATTRPRSPGEVNGADYHFLSDEEFSRMRRDEEFLEHALVFGRHWYGTPRGPVTEALERGELLILDIDVQGARQVRARLPEALFIFVEPPNDDELLRRLRSRAREDEEAIERRYREAKIEIAGARSEGLYDHYIVNDDLERAVDEACAIITKRRGGPSECA